MIIIILCTQQCYYYELFENLMIIKQWTLNLISFHSFLCIIIKILYDDDYCDSIYIVNNYFYYPNPLLQHKLKCNG